MKELDRYGAKRYVGNLETEDSKMTGLARAADVTITREEQLEGLLERLLDQCRNWDLLPERERRELAYACLTEVTDMLRDHQARRDTEKLHLALKPHDDQSHSDHSEDASAYNTPPFLLERKLLRNEDGTPVKPFPVEAPPFMEEFQSKPRWDRVPPNRLIQSVGIPVRYASKLTVDSHMLKQWVHGEWDDTTILGKVPEPPPPPTDEVAVPIEAFEQACLAEQKCAELTEENQKLDDEVNKYANESTNYRTHFRQMEAILEIKGVPDSVVLEMVKKHMKGFKA